MRAAAALLALLALPALADAPDPHMRASLVAEVPAVQPGGAVRVALQLKSDPGWHTYWRNPGDAGSPTEITWTLPAGAQAGPIEWPAPQVIREADVVIFGYEGGVLLPSTIQVPAAAKPGETLTLKAAAYYVVCREICIPGEAELDLTLPVIAPKTAVNAVPWPSPPAPRAGWSARLLADGKDYRLAIDTAGEALAAPFFLPNLPGQVPPDAPQPAAQDGKRLTLRLARAPELKQDLERIEGLLLATQTVNGREQPIAVVITAAK